MVEVFDWQRMADPREAIRRTVQALRDGELVGLPTETVYGVAANAQFVEAVERLVRCKGRPEDKPLTLALRSPLDVHDWVPGMDRLGRRLSRRCWPGPLTLVFAEGTHGGQLKRLPVEVRRKVFPNGSLGIRVPAHEAVREILTQMGGPLVLTSANLSGEPDAVTGKEVVDALGEQVRIVIDDGLTRYAQASTVVRVASGRWEVLREGALRTQTLEKLASCVILFVCTGNTCRSPIAEGLCKKLLAERLKCGVHDLPRCGFLVFSAGISALMGCGATPDAIDTARTLGVNLDGHVSQPLNYETLAQADFVFGMTRSHCEMLTAAFGFPGKGVDLLSPEGEDIPDPIGCDRTIYERCAQKIRECLERRIKEIEI